MTSAVEIVSQEEIGDLIKVRLKVKSSEIFSVEGTKLDTPDRYTLVELLTDIIITLLMKLFT